MAVAAIFGKIWRWSSTRFLGDENPSVLGKIRGSHKSRSVLLVLSQEPKPGIKREC
jgi:hypothetical protein